MAAKWVSRFEDIEMSSRGTLSGYAYFRDQNGNESQYGMFVKERHMSPEFQERLYSAYLRQCLIEAARRPIAS